MNNEILNTINKKKNYKKLSLILFIFFVVFACLVLLFLWWRAQPKKVDFQTQKVQVGTIIANINASGTLSPTNEVSIGSVISGVVSEVLVDVNDRVKKGQLLLKIDSESIKQDLAKFQAQLKSAKAELKSAKVSLDDKKWQYTQLKNLYAKTKGKTPSQLDLQNAKTAFNSALSKVELSEAKITEIETSINKTLVDLNHANIISPIDGIILSRSIEVGQSVAASFQAPEFFIIAESLEEMELNVNVSEADIGRIKEGQNVSFSVDSYPDKIFSAKVNRVNFGSNKSEDNIVNYEARIFVDNKDLLLRPGMSATADIEVQKAENAMLIPTQALYFNPQKTIEKKKASFNFFVQKFPKIKPKKKNILNNQGSVWILENDFPKEVSVEIGITNGVQTAIKSDLLNTDSKIIIAFKKEK